MQDLYPDYLIDDCNPKLYHCVNEQEESNEEKVELEDTVEPEDNIGLEKNTKAECQEKATNGQSYKGKESKAKNGKACKP